MKILSKVLLGLAGLVGGALIERGITGYGEDIAELRKKDDELEDENADTDGDEETEDENADESAEDAESEDSDG